MKKMFIEIGFKLKKPVFVKGFLIYVFKGRLKIVKVYMVKLNISILNRLKIMGFL